MLGFVISICTEIIPQLGARTPEELQRILLFLEPSFCVSSPKTSTALLRSALKGQGWVHRSLRFAGVKPHSLVVFECIP